MLVTILLPKGATFNKDTRDIEVPAGALIDWLLFAENDRKNRADKASAFARENISIEETVAKRIDFLNCKLCRKQEQGKQWNF